MTPAIKTPIDVLRAARKLIEKEENWTQGADARNSIGYYIDADGYEAAVCFSDFGAVVHVAHRLRTNVAHEAVKLLARALPTSYLSGRWASERIEHYNDNHSHADNLALFDKAITLAERDYAL